MIPLFVKEIRSFLSTLIAVLVITVFLLAISLFMWIFPDSNLLDYGYANLDILFSMAPWVFTFLIPAITMRSFSEERRMGTYEFLITKPITEFQIVMAKYLAGVVLVLFSLLPTLIYFYSVYQLGAPVGNMDTGAAWGSYLGLFFLGSCYVAIGLFASSLSDNQIIAFITAMFLCFVCFSGLEQFGKLTGLNQTEFLFEWLGIQYHYDSISRGVLDTRDVVYFLSFTALFLGITLNRIRTIK